jgi:hypothetical protein
MHYLVVYLHTPQPRPSMKLLSTHTHCPGPGHLEAGKQVIRYLKGSSKQDILYRLVGLSTGTSELNGVVSYPFCDHEDPIVTVTLTGVPKMLHTQQGTMSSMLRKPDHCTNGGALPGKKCARSA